MGELKRWERAIEQFEQTLIAKVFGREPVEVLDALRRECDDHAVVCSHSRVVVPNVYVVELADDVHAEVDRNAESVGQELTDSLARHGERKGYEWAGPLTVHITGSAHVPNGRYRVTCAPMPRIRADLLLEDGT
ncbi:DUF3662 domain-containing protein [Streptomyces sp. NRRL S-118]|uniref:DUF3662 domain-containing protein n=1 Tax=Streptomyces sp. NRRL S-118 TaxID=1463881 RepID=UPI0004CA85FA|nr:DUF3662 domain-containing protein [Streptomyces sp. NRRL S-118]